MNTNENIKMTGAVAGTITYTDGTAQEFSQSNLIMDGGKAFLASRLGANTAAAISHMAAGTGTTEGTDATKTALMAETGTRSAVTPTTSTNTATFASTFTGRTETLGEIGLFNAASSGTMVARTLVGPFPLTAGDSVSFNWTITIN